MSGICGIAHVDGASADAQVLQRMTQGMAFRGPDAQHTWNDAGAGLGHTLLRTTFEAAHERQPLSFDGQVWITADVRLDARTELVAALRHEGRDVRLDAPDVDLLLHAYHAWGEDCLTQLLGDFCFGIWDARTRTLFCARDHFGIKPFFYARRDGCLVFSNTLETVRMHPCVPQELNELAIADFLLFGENLEPDTTAFAGLMRLQNGHRLTWSARGLDVRPFWTLSPDLPLHPLSVPAKEYVPRFKEVFETAVADRLRCDRIGLEMTGGMDSTSVAVTARSILARSGKPFGISAHTCHFAHLIPDQEGLFAKMVASAAGIPLRLYESDEHIMFDRFGDEHTRQPEPFHDPTFAERRDICRDLPAQGRVFLTGWEGDAPLNESPKPYLRWLLRRGQVGAMAFEAARYAITHRRWFPRSLRDRVLGRAQRVGDELEFPEWIAPELVGKLALRDRWEAYRQRDRMSHPVRPYAYTIYAYLARASNHFDHYDAGITRQPIEYRHPFMDVRLVEFCLSLPAAPWCVQKQILRSAMKGALPEPVRKRPKTPLGTRYIALQMQRDRSRWASAPAPSPILQRFVNPDRLGLNCVNPDPKVLWRDLRAVSLDFWLRSVERDSR